MTKFQFSTSGHPDAEEFCEELVEEFVRLFGISRAEAVGRVDQAWKDDDFEPEDLRLHETPEYWANTIYFGHDSQWWTNPRELVPVAYAGPK